MATKNYKKPPITEAVIEVQFKRDHDDSLVKKFIKKAKGNYKNFDIRNSLIVEIDTESSGSKPKSHTAEGSIYRFASDDMTQQLLIHESSVVVAQLAPYCGWVDFFERFKQDWKLWKRVVGHRDIKKIGVRYINRIDVPVEGETVSFSSYVNIFPAVPSGYGPNMSYSINVRYQLKDIDALLSISSSVVRSPLINHMSLMLDQDVAKINDVPQGDEEIFAYLTKVHDVKNDIFESCIKDKARELFE